MREIKFRAWDKERKKMIYSIKDMLDGVILWEKGQLVIADNVEFGTHEEMRYLEPLLYIGLKDKNNKKVYFGDYIIMKIWNGGDGIEEPDDRDEFEGVVIWIQDNTRYGIRTKDCRKNEAEVDLISNPPFVILEVIGNIYENPNLIK